MGLWGSHCIHEQSCQGPHEVLDLGITTSLGNDLCNVARSKIDLKKKRASNVCSTMIRCNTAKIY